MPYQNARVVANKQPGSEFATVARTSTVTAQRMNSGHPYLWCFCKFCGQQTEYAIAREAVKVFRKISNGAIEVQVSDDMLANAETSANDLAAIYEKLLNDTEEIYAAGKMLLDYCDVREMGGDFSVESFRDQVRSYCLLVEWARHGDIAGAARLPGKTKGAQRPSKLYCELHYPGRSDDARRAYQRDRRFVADYEELIRIIWAQYAGRLRQWNIDDHTMVRNAAYHQLRLMKAPTRILDDCFKTKELKSRCIAPTATVKPMEDYYSVARTAFEKIRSLAEEKDWINEMKDHRIVNQSEIARRLGINRQAVSAAIKKRNLQIS